MADSDAEYLKSLSSQLFVGYNVNNRPGVQVNLPVIYRDYGRAGAHANEAGIGDASLIGNFLVYQEIEENFTFNWTALGGVKFPTGNSKHHNDEPDSALGIGGHDLVLWDRDRSTGWSARAVSRDGNGCS